jgi:transcriptional regulator with XRE-family HTH domain
MNIKKRIPTEIDEYIGRAVKSYRKKIKFTQQDLADEVGLTKGQVRRYEDSYHQMTVNRLLSFAKALRISPLKLLPDFRK